METLSDSFLVSNEAPSAKEDGSKIEGSQSEGVMTLYEHLEELRRRIIVCVMTLVMSVLAGFWLSLPALSVLEKLAPAEVVFIQLSPGEVLLTSVRIAFYIGMALASPVILYQTLRFVLPGLDAKERNLALWAVAGGSFLFVLGILFAYWAVLPPSLGFLLTYGEQVAAVQMSIDAFAGFCSGMILLTGLMFELPMLLFLLSFTGLVTSAKLLNNWRWAIVIIVVVAALLTPSQDPFTMLVVAGALFGLYGISIVPIRLMGR